ncbi:hypothetical protein [Mucilaginibacter sp. FT3.2]|uniref:hypothetical protein n=1 Tax=Mucilaginibacter sp. FT3.2 TaxID=2723090 RepID=UPI00161DEB90|nr:hypothetical protein [Mucilaginibacter sp. FT3.2]MBB6230744.1 hypothetical protein [Mucilaginibacter sp. FT3.2]
MNLIAKISCSLLSKDIDYRFAKSLKKAKEAGQVAAAINRRLFEIQKNLSSKTGKY